MPSNVGLPKTATIQNGATAVINSNVKASGGQLKSLLITNLTGATFYVKLYDKASIAVPASDVPFHVIPVATLTTLNLTGLEIRCLNGITIGVTTSVTDTDTAGTITTAKQARLTVIYK